MRVSTEGAAGVDVGGDAACNVLVESAVLYLYIYVCVCEVCKSLANRSLIKALILASVKVFDGN